MKSLLLLLLCTGSAVAGEAQLPPNDYVCCGSSGMTTIILKYSLSDMTISMSIGIISADGDVRLDWKEIEEIVAHPEGKDFTQLALARAFLAIRNGTWKPMQ
jgi:hypothetical protein